MAKIPDLPEGGEGFKIRRTVGLARVRTLGWAFTSEGILFRNLSFPEHFALSLLVYLSLMPIPHVMLTYITYS